MFGELINKYWKPYIYHQIASEISQFTRYADQLIQYKALSFDHGMLLKKLVCSVKFSGSEIPDNKELKTIYLVNGNLNYSYDIQSDLRELKKRLYRQDRVVCVLHNPYLKWLYILATLLRVRRGPLPNTFLTRQNIITLASLSGYELIRTRTTGYWFWSFFGVGDVFNRICSVIPIFKWFSYATVVVLRPLIVEKKLDKNSLSVIIPARNERGNIENALKRLAELNKKISMEVIFVEGHSKDNTWEEIQRVSQAYKHQYEIKVLQQTGKGKVDAVRTGFAVAEKELLTILDADLTMPPEDLYKFHNAYVEGLGDFVNGSRLVYPYEGQAMRLLNKFGNIFFAKTIAKILDAPISDTLCGTKLMRADDYKRFNKWRDDFGDIDPFGDFELLFPASSIGVGMIDMPIRYLDRTYGSTNINRFRHGLILLKMSILGFFKIKLAIIEKR